MRHVDQKWATRPERTHLLYGSEKMRKWNPNTSRRFLAMFQSIVVLATCYRRILDLEHTMIGKISRNESFSDQMFVNTSDRTCTLVNSFLAPDKQPLAIQTLTNQAMLHSQPGFLAQRALPKHCIVWRSRGYVWRNRRKKISSRLITTTEPHCTELASKRGACWVHRVALYLSLSFSLHLSLCFCMSVGAILLSFLGSAVPLTPSFIANVVLTSD